MTKRSCFDFISADGRLKRERGVQQVETLGRKHLMCCFWALCFIVWTSIGSIYLERTNNAARINLDYKLPLSTEITEKQIEQTGINKL